MQKPDPESLHLLGDPSKWAEDRAEFQSCLAPMSKRVRARAPPLASSRLGANEQELHLVIDSPWLGLVHFLNNKSLATSEPRNNLY